MKERPTEELRASGVLYPEDQVIAQELFEFVKTNGQKISSEKIQIRVIPKSKGSLMGIEINGGDDFHDMSLHFIKGRRGWQDNSAHGHRGVLFESSKVDPDRFQPTTQQRDEILRNVARTILQDKP